MSNDADRLRRLRALFDEALERPEAGREAWLAGRTDLDEATRSELRALLARGEETDPRWTPVVRAGATGDADDPLVGQRLGPYDVVRRIGLGGMGAVYEAVRADDQFKKRVAIKVVQSSLTSAVTLARFRRERQILANLQHKNIATLLDGGVTPDGRPFLVMEFVDGEPITTWCDRRRRSVSERIALVRQVCDAVRHAHVNLVIHRDLKPGNILVTADGSVKLLDFGVAQLTGGEDADAELPLTRGGARAFTPEYASPEQIAGEPLGTATDLYSLGVVLVELLCGHRPHGSSSGASPAATERAVLAGETARPSTLVTDADAHARGEPDAARLRRRLAGELDAIALLALRREPAERYRSVEALADDLRHHLEGRAVEAQRGLAGYRVRKFLARHRVPIAAATLVALALVGGVVATSIEARHARVAQARAERVSGFLGELLASVRSETEGRDVPVSELLDAAAKRVPVELRDAPEAQGDLEAVIGMSDMSLGRFDESEPHLREAVRLRERVFGRRSLEYVQAVNNLGMLFLHRGDLDVADSLLQAALASRRRVSSRPDTLLATVLDNVGSVAHLMGKPDESERWRRQSLAIWSAVAGPRSDQAATVINNLAVAAGEQNRWDESDSLHRVALAILRHNHRGPSLQVANVENALATALDFRGRTAEAESLYRDCLDVRARVLGRDHPDYAFTLMNYSIMVANEGRYDEAIALNRQLLALRGRTLPDAHPVVATALQTLGRCLDHTGHEDEAGRMLEESLALRRRNYGSDHWLVASSMSVLGEHWEHLRQFARAEALLLGADAILVRTTGAQGPRRAANLRRLLTLYRDWGRPERAAAIQRQLEAAAKP